MSHDFTQPEEMDRILMTMAVYDPESDRTDQDGMQSSRTIQEALSDKSVSGSYFPYVF